MDPQEQSQHLLSKSRSLDPSPIKGNLGCSMSIRAQGSTTKTQDMAKNTPQDLSTIIQAYEDGITHLEDALLSIFNNNNNNNAILGQAQEELIHHTSRSCYALNLANGGIVALVEIWEHLLLELMCSAWKLSYNDLIDDLDDLNMMLLHDSF